MLKKIFQNWESQNSKSLVGRWKLDSNNTESINEYGNTFIEFKDSGELIYTIYMDNKEQKIYMTYKIEKDYIITNQPSSPQIEQTKYRVMADGILILYFNNIKSVYIKVEQ